MKIIWHALSMLLALQATAENAEPGLILDLDASKGVVVEDGDRVSKWVNQVSTFKARDFVKQDKGREKTGSGRPTLKKSAAIGDNHTLVFRQQELINHDEDAFDHLTTGSGHTWFAVISVYEQEVQVKDVNSFFGNLRNGGRFEGIWGNVTDDNRLWIGCRNGLSFGRWDKNNPMVAAKKPFDTNTYYVVAGRMGAGIDKVLIEAFINSPEAVASEHFPVNPEADASKMAIGQERDAIQHPGKESFDGEIARLLIYERPLSDKELASKITALKKQYAIK